MSTQVYNPLGGGLIGLFPNPIISDRNPTTTDIVSPTGAPYQVFQGWNNRLTDASYIYLGSGNWVLFASIVGSISQISGNTGTAVPTAGNVNIVGAGTLSFAGSGSTLTGTITPGTGLISTINSNAPIAGNYVLAGTANQITITQTAGTSTFTIPSAFIAPGSIAATTTLTATLGAITATNGNLVGSTSGTGLLLNSPTGSGVAASPVVVNGRSGRATFTTVSIAAAADLTLTITNSSITASTTQVLISMSGATTGSALSIKSKTASSGSLAIVVTNGTGATTTTSDIQIDFLVVNA